MRVWTRFALASVALAALTGCDGETGRTSSRAYAPVPGATLALMEAKGTTRNAPVLVRAYKQDSEIEIWKQASNGDYVHLKTFPVCRWSGQLGPKTREGDRQVPEGFYTVAAAQMNPNSAYWLSFNVGYPNSLERALGRNGGDIMVHGTCSSRGCFAMTNQQIEEIYAIMREAFAGGQKQIQFQSFPFRMTAENMAKYRADPNIAFWRNLKEGADHFEVTKAEPRVNYCGGKYVFNATPVNARFDATSPCPEMRIDEAIASAVAGKQRADAAKIAELVQRGAPAVRVQYVDGGQHMSFRPNAFAYADQSRDGSLVVPPALFGAPSKRNLGDVSRPEAIGAHVEYAVDETTGHRKIAAPVLSASIVPGPVAAPASSTRPSSGEAAPTRGATPADPNAFNVGLGLGAVTSLFNNGWSVLAPLSPVPDASTASATGPTPATPAADAPFFKRWLGLGGDAPTAAPEPANVPVPPRRQAETGAGARVVAAR